MELAEENRTLGSSAASGHFLQQSLLLPPQELEHFHVELTRLATSLWGQQARLSSLSSEW